jgi:hypothetical protein
MCARLLWPRTAQLPQAVKLSAPYVCDDIHVRSRVRSENERTRLCHTCTNSLLQPLGYPCVHLPSAFGGSDVTFPVASQPIYVECAYIGNPQPGIYGNRDKVCEVLAGPPVSVINHQSRLCSAVMHFGRPSCRPLPVLRFTRFKHPLNSSSLNGRRSSLRGSAFARLRGLRTRRAGLRPIHSLLSANSKNAFSELMFLPAVAWPTPHEVRRARPSASIGRSLRILWLRSAPRIFSGWSGTSSGVSS